MPLSRFHCIPVRSHLTDFYKNCMVRVYIDKLIGAYWPLCNTINHKIGTVAHINIRDIETLIGTWV